MRKKLDISKYIKLNKKYKEEMANSQTEMLIFSSGEQKEEDFQWINQLDKNSKLLKKNYLRFPVNEWQKIINENFNFDNIDKKSMYQETVNKILEKDIFKNEKFLKEEKGKNIFQSLLQTIDIDKEDFEKKKETELIKINPDFIVLNMERKSFISLIKSRDYMLKFGKKITDLKKEIRYINIIGEIKNNADNIDKIQRKRYLSFCEYMNEKSGEQYFIIFYIFDVSYVKLFEKKFYQGKPCIIGYIPQTYSNKYLKNYYLLLDKQKEEKEIKKEENGHLLVKKDLGNENQKENKEKEMDENTIYTDKKNEEKEENENIITTEEIYSYENKKNPDKEMEDNVIFIDDESLPKDKKNEENYGKKEKVKIIIPKKEEEENYDNLNVKQLTEIKRETEDTMISLYRNIEDEMLNIVDEEEKMNQRINEYKKEEEEKMNQKINEYKKEENLKFKLFKREKEDNILKKKRHLEDKEIKLSKIKKEIKKKSKK